VKFLLILFHTLKKILILLLFIPSLCWSSEEKAREMYVKAKSDLLKNSCDLDLIATKFTGLYLETEPITEINIAELIDEVKICGNYYKNNTLPVFEYIIQNYPSTEVAYNLMSSNEYVSAELIDAIMILLKSGSVELLKNPEIFN